ncbi:hypothetical protein ABEW34_18905 [Paenibacillus algorifonticola]|uniref:hypothetical protein n=1 Tax=Paenibacillus algorifonticola TaxID=684063 RepID=UPI003D2E512F
MKSKHMHMRITNSAKPEGLALVYLPRDRVNLETERNTRRMFILTDTRSAI